MARPAGRNPMMSLRGLLPVIPRGGEDPRSGGGWGKELVDELPFAVILCLAMAAPPNRARPMSIYTNVLRPSVGPVS